MGLIFFFWHMAFTFVSILSSITQPIQSYLFRFPYFVYFVDFVQLLWGIWKACYWTVFRYIFPPTEKHVRNEIVLVTGSAKGLGRYIALEFAKRGATIVLWDIDVEGLTETVRLLKEHGHNGGKVFSFVCDLRDRSTIRNVAKNVRKDVGDVTILVNNAGKVVGHDFLHLSDTSIEETIQVNLMSLFWTTKEFLPSMVAKNHGHIVTIASGVGLIGLKGLVDYSASKFGAIGFAETLDTELHLAGYEGISTTLVCPSQMNKGMFSRCSPRQLASRIDAHETAKEIVNAVLTNKKQLYLPKSVYLLTLIKSILPTTAMYAVQRFIGADTFCNRLSKTEAFQDRH